MAIGLRKKSIEVPEEPADEAGTDEKAPPVVDVEWHEADLDPFMLDNVPEERVAPAPAAARPTRPAAKTRKPSRPGLLTYASYVLLFVTAASLSAAVVLIFA
jgi:hypothetical protein